LARRAILQATHRDAMSGGSVTVYHVTADGWRALECTNVGPLFWEYEDAKKNNIPMAV
jgi:20S proteasome subunit beta 5